jgi:t-SNARE complex subunit (syntaxin)
MALKEEEILFLIMFFIITVILVLVFKVNQKINHLDDNIMKLLNFHKIPAEGFYDGSLPFLQD